MTRRTLLMLWVPGRPAPQGSMTPIRRGPKLGVKAANEKVLKPWRAQITAFALDRWGGATPLDEALCATLVFRFRRPGGHFNVAGELNKQGRENPYPANRGTGDGDKLVRAVFDGLEAAGVLADDARIVEHHARKEWGDKEGVQLWLQPMNEGDGA